MIRPGRLRRTRGRFGRTTGRLIGKNEILELQKEDEKGEDVGEEEEEEKREDGGREREGGGEEQAGQ